MARRGRIRTGDSYPDEPTPWTGFQAAMKRMRSRDGWTSEDGFHLLRDRAAEHAEELIAAFEQEADSGMRWQLLELIGEARSPLAFDLLVRMLRDEDSNIRYWARAGLKKLDTKEARRILWEMEQG